MNEQEIEKNLLAALANGAKPNGVLRTDFGIPTEPMERMIGPGHGLFKRATVNGRPGVELRLGTSERDLRQLAILREARVSGVSQARLANNHKIPTAESSSFAERFEDITALVERTDKKGKTKSFLVLKSFIAGQCGTPAAADREVVGGQKVLGARAPGAAPSSLELEAPNDLKSLASTGVPFNTAAQLEGDMLALAGMVVLHLQAGWRTSEWLLAMGITMDQIRSVAATFPDILQIEAGRIGIYEWKISLIPKAAPEVAPEPERRVVNRPPDKNSPAEWPAGIGPEQIQQMMRRPPSPGMARRRGSQINPERVQYRKRNPSVVLPPDP